MDAPELPATPDYWLEVTVVTDGEAAEAVAEALRPLAHQESVVLEQLGDAASLDPYALEPEVAVKIYLPGDQDTQAVRRRIEELLYYLGRLYPIPAPTFRKLQDEDWANAWKAHYTPFRVGCRLWIQPSWVEELATRPDDIILTLDPGMAFGTGLHPTTQMCLQAVEELVRPGMRVLDVGTGSGILAIAAALLGAGRESGGTIVAVDTDRLAVAAAVENAARNRVQIDVHQGSLASVPPGNWDLVIVNILAPAIVTMLQNGLMVYVAEAGSLLLSGIIEEQLPGVEVALEAAGGQIIEKRQIRDWVGLTVRPARRGAR
ncbi:MAG: 50S ribosomal protein L11 methyltransferase [Anaerolineae bacterium]|nr:50S ribosomal protein L11 methyltransferase [Anaerolineae bacterium]